MWLRYQMYLDGREPLLSMANACLTLVEGSAASKNGRDAAERLYAIDKAVLSRLGHWAADKGGPGEARKLGSKATMIPLTDAEKRWLESAIKVLIRRNAEYDYDRTQTLSQITMADIR